MRLIGGAPSVGDIGSLLRGISERASRRSTVAGGKSGVMSDIVTGGSCSCMRGRNGDAGPGNCCCC